MSILEDNDEFTNFLRDEVKIVSDDELKNLNSYLDDWKIILEAEILNRKNTGN